MNIYIQLFDERLLVPRVYILEPEKCGFAVYGYSYGTINVRRMVVLSE